jgi:hypothetical protein
MYILLSAAQVRSVVKVLERKGKKKINKKFDFKKQLQSSVSAIKLGSFVLPPSPRGFFFFAQIKGWKYHSQGLSFTCEP